MREDLQQDKEMKLAMSVLNSNLANKLDKREEEIEMLAGHFLFFNDGVKRGKSS